jgi:hypothetical protein
MRVELKNIISKVRAEIRTEKQNKGRAQEPQTQNKGRAQNSKTK